MKYVALLWLFLFIPVCGQAKQLVRLPVYFNIITDGSFGHLSKEELQNSIKLLNKGFIKTPFRFYIARIKYIENKKWFNIMPQDRLCMTSPQLNEIKETLHLGTTRVLNIYTVNFSHGTMGCSILPEDSILNPKRDGVIVDFRYVYSNVLVHEVGHLFGLLHVPIELICGNYMEELVPLTCSLFFNNEQIKIMIKAFKKYKY